MGDNLFSTYRKKQRKAFGLAQTIALGLMGGVGAGCGHTGAGGDSTAAPGDASGTSDAQRQGTADGSLRDLAVGSDARGTLPDALPAVPDAVNDARRGAVDGALAGAPDLALDASPAVPADARAPGPDGFLDSAHAADPDLSADARAVAAQDAGTGDSGADARPIGPNAPLPDLMIIPEHTLEDMYFEEREFAPDSCALVEGCVGGPGLRRLLRFGVSAANVGDADLVMGDPADTPELFEFSPCHGHFHFTDYASYSLLDAQGTVVSPGHKQAFCLIDSGIYLDGDPTVRQMSRYECEFQGISRGWYDRYRSGLDCQWIDVTDVESGDYALRVRINPERVLSELDYDNNDLDVSVTVPSFDMGVPCGPNDDAGPDRMCGWQLGFSGQCQLGELIDAGCLQAGPDCALADCPEQPLLRACAGAARSCLPAAALAASQNDCGTCPRSTFRCPAGGAYTLWLAAPDPGLELTCEVDVSQRPEPPIDTPCPVGDAVEGLASACGWGLSGAGPVACLPGRRYLAGCTGGAQGCGVGPACQGDPMLAVCPGAEACTSPERLAASDNSCNGSCPSVTFVCPENGLIGLYVASYRPGEASTCEPALVQLN